MLQGDAMARITAEEIRQFLDKVNTVDQAQEEISNQIVKLKKTCMKYVLLAVKDGHEFSVAMEKIGHVIKVLDDSMIGDFNKVLSALEKGIKNRGKK